MMLEGQLRHTRAHTMQLTNRQALDRQLHAHQSAALQASVQRERKRLECEQARSQALEAQLMDVERAAKADDAAAAAQIAKLAAANSALQLQLVRTEREHAARVAAVQAERERAWRERNVLALSLASIAGAVLGGAQASPEHAQQVPVRALCLASAA
jgi:hypothetical protein